MAILTWRSTSARIIERTFACQEFIMSALAPARPPARWWHPLEDKKVVCQLCPRQCHIPLGGRGFCFVRANVDGRLELTTYGRSSGFCIDPVEKKPLNHFLPGTPILSFGTAGCNLGCKFCQNWDISKSRAMDTLAQLALPDAIVDAALRTGCRSLAFTYNDPVIWAEYALDIAKAAHAHGLKTVAVTAGYISREARGEFYEHMDAANVDLKAFTADFYLRLCQAKLDPILDTLKFLKHQTQVWFELTTLMIPGENDSPDETKAMCGWIVENLGPDVPVHFTAFHPDFKMLQTPPTPPDTLVRARQIALAAGIRYAYVGNVNDATHQSTYCHACGKLLIQRDWYDLGEYHLRGNACGHCGAVIPGLFDETGPGHWGRKRQPIMMGDDANRLVRITTPMSRNPSSAPSPAPSDGAPRTPAPQIDFTPEQDAEILAFARAIVEATLRDQLFSKARLPDPLAQAPAFGMFVSLFRSTQLRSCKGQWGGTSSGGLAPLSQMLAHVARDAASNDPRFPRITLPELPFLKVEVSLMHSPQQMTARGDARVRCVEVGTHGLVIGHPAGHGLLLPQVAVEAGWDARTFLEQVCLKAGLPPQTWRDDQARLMTFQARKLTDPASRAELDLNHVGSGGLTQLFSCIQQWLAGGTDEAIIPPQTQAPHLHEIHPEELGLCLQTASGATGAAVAPHSSLLNLAKTAAQSLAGTMAQRGLSEPVRTMTILTLPQALVAADYPARHQLLARCAVLAQADERWALAIPQPGGPADMIAQALTVLRLTPQQWRQDRTGRLRLTAFSALQCQNQVRGPAAPNPAAPPAPQVRPAFRAGAFYPAAPAQMTAEVQRCLDGGGLGQIPARTYRAIMLPHAGWLFCGGTMGKTLAGVKLPPTAIILGPRHTPLGANCSVASHTAWQIPGATIPVVVPLAQRLSRALPFLACESEAHRQEHGTEVVLPFLLRLRPDLRIVPIVLGQCSLDQLAALARELAAILRAAQAAGEEPPLLVISSDLNHFAPEPENRRLDLLALDAMQTGNPRHLFDTCMKHDISMCGVLPAVTVMQALQQDAPAIQPRLVDYSNSAAASGDTQRVVGYAGVVIP
jgi:AmmeMemoRadiSam system radical SAM enzyme/AmmeMemoRadiSam system protein B/AmmeMemoRadiSam system protein A